MTTVKDYLKKMLRDSDASEVRAPPTIPSDHESPPRGRSERESLVRDPRRVRLAYAADGRVCEKWMTEQGAGSSLLYRESYREDEGGDLVQ